MKGDFSRNTFDPAQRYSSVRMQQGRVQLDADWNEQVDITRYRAEVGAADIIGGCGGPLHDAAFRVVLAADELGEELEGQFNERFPGSPEAGDFILSAGRYYVDGILCESEYPVPFLQQPDLPGVVLDPTGDADERPRDGFYIVYLDVWQRHLTALEAPRLRETALGGADTATRTRTIWQVRSVFAGVAGENDSDVHCLSVINDEVTSPGTGKLRAQASLEKADPKPCIIPPSAGYRGLENQLYRVEIHQAGEATDMEGGAIIDAADPNALTVHATYKWSRDNGIVVSRIEKIAGAQVTVENMGRDEVLGFASGQWAEIVDEARELRGEPGVLARIESVDPESRTVTLYATPSWPDDIRTEADDSPGGLKLRGWDGVGAVKTHAADDDAAWIELEAGVQVAFDEEGTYRTGDYWLIPTRTATAEVQSGNIEWPVDDDAKPVPQPPLGIKHHYCKLAVVEWDGAAIQLVEDCRCLFAPVTEVNSLSYVSGAGQEVMPDLTDLEILPLLGQPLVVGIPNGHCQDSAQVRFRVMEGHGRLGDTGDFSGDQPTDLLDVPIGHDGLARCWWRLDGTTQHQVVEARLLEGGIPVQLPILFNASLSVAREVAYDPQECRTLADQKTVQDALDRVVDLVRIYPVGGQGQEAMPGEKLEPLRVLVTSTCGPIASIENAVKFRILEGDGTLEGGNSEIECPTNSSGIAAVEWKLDTSTHYQEVEAMLLVDPAAEPSTVRFGATLSRASHVAYNPAKDCRTLADATTVQEALDQLCRGENGIRIREIRVGEEAAQVSLENDSHVTVDLLAGGITVLCDDALDPAAIENKPVVDVSLDLPWPVPGQEFDYWWGASRGVLGYRPLRLNAQARARDEQIRWHPEKETARWLQDVGGLFGVMEEMRLGDRVLARLTLKGNFIWATRSPDIYLDGEVFGAPDEGRTGLRLDEGSGDGRRGGDFEMWFWLTRSAVTELGLVIETYIKANSIVGQVTDRSGESIAGVQLTLAGTQFGTLTNAEGRFLFSNVSAGTYDLRATSVGYPPTTVRVTVPGAEREPTAPELVPRALGVRLEDVAEIGPRRSQLLRDSGVKYPVELLFMTPDEVAERAGVTASQAKSLISSAKRLFQ